MSTPIASTWRGGALWRLLVTAAIQLAFLGALLLLSALNRPQAKLTGFDQMALPGERITLKAKIERDGPGFLNPDLVGVEIEFLSLPPLLAQAAGELMPDPEAPLPADAVSLGASKSDLSGVSELETVAPAAPGNHPYWVRLKDARQSELRQSLFSFTISVQPAEQPIVITDIDHTISLTRTRPVLRDQPEKIEPLPGSAELLRELAKNHRIVYLTARSSYLAHRTRRWLSVHRFPTGPVFLRDLFSQWRHFNLNEGEFKQSLIREHIKNKWLEIRWGFGNRRGDVEAYGENGIRGIMIAMDPEDIPGRYRHVIRVAADWEQARKIVSP